MALTRIPDPVNKQPSAVNPQPPSVNAQPSNAGLTREPDVAAGGGPAVPALSAPAANANIFNGVAVTLTATSTDVNLGQMAWVLDPSGSNTIVATVVGAGTPAGTFSTTWTPSAVSDAAHTLVARATRAAQSTDSATATVNVGEVLHTLVSSVTCLRNWQSDFGVHDAGGGVCDTWTDIKSSVAASQATGARQPVITANGASTHPVLRFDGVDDFLTEATLDLPAPPTATFIWAVIKQHAWTAAHGPFACSDTRMQLAGLTSSPNLAGFNGAQANNNSGAAIDTIVRVEMRFVGTAADYIKIAATTTTGASFGTNNPAAGVVLGTVSGATNGFNGDLACVMYFSGVPSGAELAALSAAAAAMYGASV